MADQDDIDLQAFHAGGRGVLTAVYRKHVDEVEGTVSRYCRGADAECVTHELFLSIVEKQGLRQQFQGGDLGAWLRTLGARRAIDHLRRRKRTPLLFDPGSMEGRLEPVGEEQGILDRDQARQLHAALGRFASEEAPDLDERTAGVFRLRFQEQITQKAAALRLGIPRSTFISYERRLMKRLGAYLRRHLGGENA